jgi:hypothetical protein
MVSRPFSITGLSQMLRQKKAAGRLDVPTSLLEALPPVSDPSDALRQQAALLMHLFDLAARNAVAHPGDIKFLDAALRAAQAARKTLATLYVTSYGPAGSPGAFGAVALPALPPVPETLDLEPDNPDREKSP